MLRSSIRPLAAAMLAIFLTLFFLATGVRSFAQAANSSSITGVVVDPAGAVVPGAKVGIHNPVSGFAASAVTDGAGKFTLANIPFNPYHLTVTKADFAKYERDVEVRSAVALELSISLRLVASNATVTVEAASADLIENTPSFHTDVDRNLFDKIPQGSTSSSVSSLVTGVTPGISADSNGMFHGLGDHADNQFSVDGQPITDQQSKNFSNQIPENSIQSMEVISGAPPAEYGGKTSLVINVTTRSGLGATTPHGSLSSSYGSFGTSTADFDLSYGGQRWGNFIALSGMNTGRFLDTPEFRVMHDKGNQESLFDHVDFQLSNRDSIHTNLQFSRSWFQTPNSYDQQNATAWSGAVVDNGGLDPYGMPVGPADQRSKILTFNLAPTWNRLLSDATLLTLGGFVRRDDYRYFPTGNPFADLAPNLQTESMEQHRTLTNAGARMNLSYVKGIHNLKAGATYQQTFLDERDGIGIVDPTLNPVCLNADGSPDTDPSVTSPAQCAGLGETVNPEFNPLLLPYDMTRGGTRYQFDGHANIKELGLYVQDSITKGSWNFQLGLRGDLYNGLTSHGEIQPRLGAAYYIKPTGTVLRVSYARAMETPFNENLVLSSVGCADAVLNPLLSCSSADLTPLSPGWRNEFHVGLQQAFGRYLVFSGDYIWKYTHHAYDFSILGNTPITFPVEWERSKIPGFAGRISVPNLHGFSAQVVFSSISARFFTPQVAGAGATPEAPTGVFRIDHDERFNQSTHLQYQPWKQGPWFGFSWRYDSGQVAGEVPFAATAGGAVDTSGLSADQQFQGGLYCGAVRATPTQALPASCPGAQFGSTLLQIPAPGTENDDKNPPRMRARHLFDLSIGDDNIFGSSRYKWSAQFTVLNLTNNYALYNYLSTFSGTHYVSPHSYTGRLGFHF